MDALDDSTHCITAVTLLRKHQKAIVNILESELVFAQLRGSQIVEENRAQWLQEGRYAQRMHKQNMTKALKEMLIFDVTDQKGWRFTTLIRGE